MKRALLLFAIAAVLAGMFGPPLANGYHFGCSNLDTARTNVLGVELCK